MGIRQRLVLVVCVTAVACGGGATSGPGAEHASGVEGADDARGGEGGEAKGGPAPAKAPAAGTKSLEKRTASLVFDLTLKKGEHAGGMQAGSWSLEEERAIEVLANLQMPVHLDVAAQNEGTGERHGAARLFRVGRHGSLGVDEGAALGLGAVDVTV